MLKRFAVIAAVLCSVATGFGAAALAQHFDVTVQENLSDGRISIHGFDFDVLPQFSIVVDKRVFGRSFGISGSSLLTDDPGFVSRVSPTELDPAGLLPIPASESLEFNILAAPSTLPELGGRNLSYWDGTGSVTWSAVPDTEELSVLKGLVANPDAEAIADGGTTDVPGFVIGGTSGIGSLHEHMKFLLLPDGLAAPPTGPDDGVYLLLMEARYEVYAEWVPVWLMFKAFAGGQSTLDLAIADVSARFQLPLCSDGIDNDKDGRTDDNDPGCLDPNDMSEKDAALACDDGLDGDGDGLIDFPADPGCLGVNSPREDPACDDDIDNDSDGKIDWDGGAGAGTPDPQCANKPWKTSESSACGLGFEAALLLLPWAFLRGLRRRSGPSGRWNSGSSPL